jgi:hypothetical protein
MGVLRFIPILVIPLLIYTFVAITQGANTPDALAGVVFSMHVASGDQFILTMSGLITLIAVLCLFLEVVRSAIPNRNALIENMATAILLVLCIGIFLLVRGFGTAEFFLLTLLLLLDYLTDSTIMVFTARRTVQYESN